MLTLYFIFLIISLSCSVVAKVEVRICLIGDSLLSKSVKAYNFTTRLVEDLTIRLPQYTFLAFEQEVVNYIQNFFDEHNGIHIAHNARSRLHCDAMALLWDSDVSDFHEELLSKSDFLVHRMNYTKQLTYFANSVAKEGMKFFISGPKQK